MAITYPRSLPPELIISGTNVSLVEVSSVPRRELGGPVFSSELGDPYWKFEVAMKTTTVENANRLRAWKASLRGGAKSFLGHNQAARRPAAYPTDADVLALTRAGGGAFNGFAVVTSFPDPYSIAVSSASSQRLPAGFQIKTGDMVGLVKTGTPNKYFLHEVMENATADGAGNLTISVNPFVLTNIFAPGDSINFIAALGEFIIDPTASDDGMITRTDNSFSIKAYSTVY